MSKIYQLEQFVRGSFTGAVARRRVWYQNNYKLPIHRLPYRKWSPEEMYQRAYRKNCENIVGFTSVPVGLVGPLQIDQRDRFLPIATTEGALVASLNRGSKLFVNGIDTNITDVGMTRAPILSFRRAGHAKAFCEWVQDNQDVLTNVFEGTSRYCTLKSIEPVQCGRDIHLKFRASTDDAMGMNMVTKGCNAVLGCIQQEWPDVMITAVSGNYCTDKKVSATNWVTGRGKRVIADALIPKLLVKDVLGCSAEDLVNLNVKKNLVGSALAGTLGGFNAHAANIVAGLYLATGQDLGQIGTSSCCITQIEDCDEDIIASVTMPSVEVGIVGGGTGLPAQSDALELAGVSSSTDLARLIGGGVLAGELSLLGSLCKGDLMQAHLQLNRGESV